jgi:hypothetical protein
MNLELTILRRSLSRAELSSQKDCLAGRFIGQTKARFDQLALATAIKKPQRCGFLPFESMRVRS